MTLSPQLRFSAIITPLVNESFSSSSCLLQPRAGTSDTSGQVK